MKTITQNIIFGISIFLCVLFVLASAFVLYPNAQKAANRVTNQSETILVAENR